MTLLAAIGVGLAGVLVGIMSALFGVGGGILRVPFMVLVLDLTQHTAEGTSLLVVVPTAIAGTIAHRRHGYVDATTALRLGVGGVMGAVAGALVGLDLSGSTLRLLFAVLLAIVGARVIYEGLTEKATSDD